MDDWQSHPLDALCSVVRRGRAPAYEGGTTPVVNQKCIRNSRVDMALARATNEEAKSLPEWALITENDVLVNSTGTGTLGRVAWFRQAPGRVSADSHVTILRPDQSRILTPYLGLTLHIQEEFLATLGTGSTNQKELGATTLKEMTVLVPPIAVQRRVVDFAQCFDDAVESTERELNTLGVARMSALRALISGDAEIPAAYDEMLNGREADTSQGKSLTT